MKEKLLCVLSKRLPTVDFTSSDRSLRIVTVVYPLFRLIFVFKMVMDSMVSDIFESTDNLHALIERRQK